MDTSHFTSSTSIDDVVRAANELNIHAAQAGKYSQIMDVSDRSPETLSAEKERQETSIIKYSTAIASDIDGLTGFWRGEYDFFGEDIRWSDLSNVDLRGLQELTMTWNGHLEGLQGF